MREAEARVGDVHKQVRQGRWFAAITCFIAIVGLAYGLATRDLGFSLMVVGNLVIIAPVVFAAQFGANRKLAEETGYRDALERDCPAVDSDHRSISGLAE